MGSRSSIAIKIFISLDDEGGRGGASSTRGHSDAGTGAGWYLRKSATQNHETICIYTSSDMSQHAINNTLANQQLPPTRPSPWRFFKQRTGWLVIAVQARAGGHTVQDCARTRLVFSALAICRT
ncbi:hypothetical protein MN608_00336 [Microdochium nivale]|nr:hypothetical protein MN608_00336 [Microdochium nivale]